MNTRTLAVLGLAMAIGCGKGGAKGGSDDKGGASSKHQMTITEVLGASKKPALIGPYSTGKFGMTQDEMKAANPAYAKDGDFLAKQDWGIGFYAGFEGPVGDESAKTHPKRFTTVIITVKDADVNAIKTAWGAPTEIDHRGKPASVWLNPEDKVRAVLQADDPGEQKLTIEPYLPTKTILGEPGKPLGIETKPFIGSTVAELQAAYPDNFERSLDTLAFMQWPPDDFGSAFKMELAIKDGKVKSIQYWITHGKNETVKAAKKAEIEAKYGPAHEVKREYLGPETVMAENPKVTLADNSGTWVVEIGFE